MTDSKTSQTSRWNFLAKPFSRPTKHVTHLTIESIREYQYEPLEHENDIRLLKLLPGVTGDDIHIEVYHARLQQPELSPRKRMTVKEIKKTLPPGWEAVENFEGRYIFCPGPPAWEWTRSHPEPTIDASLYRLPPQQDHWSFKPSYEALSYTWGSSSKRERVFVRSILDHPQATLAVGENLFNALKHLRLLNRPRHLWIDAICINQIDNAEKSRQVHRMGRIFSLARCVVVWLGELADQSGLALRALEDIGNQTDLTKSNHLMRAIGAKKPTWFLPGVDLPFENETWYAIWNLLGRSWFERLWVVQEVNLADPRFAVIQCGPNTIPWALFRRSIGCLVMKNNLDPGLRDRLDYANCMCLGRSSAGITSVFQNHSLRECYDRRDKVYGLLWLCPPRFRCQILPDYSASVEDTYKAVLLCHLDQMRRWELLPLDWRHRTITAPSWVPDFSTARSTKRDSSYQRSSGNSEIHYRHPSLDILEVIGLQCATIAQVGMPLPKVNKTEEEFRRVVASWWHLLSSADNAPYITGESLLNAYTLTIVQNSTEERLPDSEWHAMTKWKRMIDEAGLLYKPCANPLDFSSNNGDTIQSACSGRRFMISKEGYIGLVPHCVSPGKNPSQVFGNNPNVIGTELHL